LPFPTIRPVDDPVLEDLELALRNPTIFLEPQEFHPQARRFEGGICLAPQVVQYFELSEEFVISVHLDPRQIRSTNSVQNKPRCRLEFGWSTTLGLVSLKALLAPLAVGPSLP